MKSNIFKIALSAKQYQVFLKYGPEALSDTGKIKILETIKKIGGGVILLLEAISAEDANALRHSRFILD